VEQKGVRGESPVPAGGGSLEIDGVQTDSTADDEDGIMLIRVIPVIKDGEWGL
jgi:hypothetical protein